LHRRKETISTAISKIKCNDFVNFNKTKYCNNNILNLNAMNAMKNKVQLIGHVGQEPEVKTFGEGKKVANITLATNDYYTNAKGEKVEDTQWHKVKAWGKVADIIEKYVTKGKEICIEGKLTYSDYLDKDGVKRYVTEIVANDILLLGK
jgi:single-strand DNA-binding protein